MPLRRITAACLREMLPSLIARSDDLLPRPMMNWSLSIGMRWLLNTRNNTGVVPFDGSGVMRGFGGAGVARAGRGGGTGGAPGICARALSAGELPAADGAGGGIGGR